MDPLLENEQTEDNTIGINDERPELKGKLTGYLAFCLLVAAFGAAFQFGWSLAVFNTPSEVIQDFYKEVDNTLTKDKVDDLWAITNGLVPLGGIFGGLSSGFLADRVGRKNGLIVINVLVVIAAILNLISKAANTYYTIMIGRFFTGAFLGFFSGILPLYLSELSPPNLRGTVGTLNQLLIVFGILVTNILGLPELLGSEKLWLVLVGLSLVPAAVHLLLFFSIESPKHLVFNKNDIPKAKEALMKIRNNDQRLVEQELQELLDEKERISQQSQVKWSEFFTKNTLKRPLIVTIAIQMAQQLSGINAVIFYSNKIFISAGLEDSWPIYATILLGVIQLIMTFVCMALIDRLGRKILLLAGMIGMATSSFLLATFRVLSEKNPNESWINIMTVVAAISYIVFFSIGPGAIPWLITSELFASDSRGKATSIAVFINYLSNFLVTVSFIFIERGIGSYSFIIFGVIGTIGSLFILFFVPETKNKSIDAIISMFETRYIFLRN